MATTTASDTSDERPEVSTRAARQRAAHAVGDPPRRTMAIGTVWIIGLVCLLVGALLNAPGIRKTALSQEVGWHRDAAKLLAGPLFDVSHAFLLDRPRAGIQEAIGRSGQDDVEFELPGPTIRRRPTATGTPPTTVKPAKKPAFSPSKQLRLWVGGDSLSITPGESVINQAAATQVVGITAPVDGHVATGLSRPEVFNWAQYMNDVLNANQPDLVVLTLGSNDDQPVTGENATGEFGTEAWKNEYRRRVGGLMDFITGSGDRKLIWIAVPPMRNEQRYYGRYLAVNDIVRDEAAKRSDRVRWIDPSPIIGDENGAYADVVTNPDGSVVQVRAGDGIHFTRAGGDRIAAAVLAEMHKLFDLTSWQRAATTTTTTRPAG